MPAPFKHKPKINLKQHKRFEKKSLWPVIRKFLLFLVFAGLVYYGLNALKTHLKTTNSTIENNLFEVEIE